MTSKVEKIVPQEDNPNLAGGVVVNGTTIPCDFIVMGVGVAPATAFLKDSGIELEKDGGIKVDEYLRVKSGKDMKNVYAIGMLIIHAHLYSDYDSNFRGYCNLSSAKWRGDEDRALECRLVSHHATDNIINQVQVAGNHGRSVGATIAGNPQPFVKVPIFWSARMSFQSGSIHFDLILIYFVRGAAVAVLWSRCET